MWEVRKELKWEVGGEVSWEGDYEDTAVLYCREKQTGNNEKRASQLAPFGYADCMFARNKTDVSRPIQAQAQTDTNTNLAWL
jgi:hypothetical protein